MNKVDAFPDWWRTPGQPLTVHFPNCPGCHGDHTMRFKQLPELGDMMPLSPNPDATHWAPCFFSGELIFLTNTREIK